MACLSYSPSASSLLEIPEATCLVLSSMLPFHMLQHPYGVSFATYGEIASLNLF